MCSSLDGSQNRAATSTAAIFAQEMRSRPAGSRCSHRSSSPIPRHSASARYTSPNWRERSTRMPFRRTGTHIPAAVVKQLRFFGSADQMPGQRTRLEPATLIELAKMRDSLLNDQPTHANAAYKTPVTVNLPVLLANRVAQIHATNK